MEKKKQVDLNKASLKMFFEGSYWHLKFDINGFSVKILCKLFTLSSLQLNANHTHMLASHFRQPPAICVIRVCELDIYGCKTIATNNKHVVNLLPLGPDIIIEYRLYKQFGYTFS